VLAAVDQEGLGQCGAAGVTVCRDHDSHRSLAEVGVVYAYDGDVVHGRVVEENVLRLPRIDVDAPADDQIPVAVGQVEVALVVEPADVADREAGARGVVGGGRLLRVADVAETTGVRWGIEVDPSDRAGRARRPASAARRSPAVRAIAGW
jgi:hypothetical protein